MQGVRRVTSVLLRKSSRSTSTLHRNLAEFNVQLRPTKEDPGHSSLSRHHFIFPRTVTSIPSPVLIFDSNGY
ncbi:hypothetical protein E2C01_017943 [Portunus trituberculatus]|uniref:Uncharacterized protein n=1 Tax=Portunus trituberculatus TaxID=210409 RepID=A0A5B7DUX0_PORTR|nr:hypothetical protein [Portunus trituberculatus]